MSDEKDAAAFVAEHKHDLAALNAERVRRLEALNAAPSFGYKVLARATATAARTRWASRSPRSRPRTAASWPW
jgi:hypothetical protein